MTRGKLLALIAATLFAFTVNAPVAVQALSPLRGGAISASCPGPTQVNPGGQNSTPDGNEIVVQQVGVQSCTLQDRFGTTYAFLGNGLIFDGTGPYFGYTDIAIEASGYAMRLIQTCPGAPTSPAVWLYNTSQWVNPAASKTALPSPLPFKLTRGASTFSFPDMADAMASMIGGDFLEVLPLQAGLPLWWGAGRVSGGAYNNGTIQIDTNSALGCSTNEGQVITFDTSNGSMNGWTVRGQSSASADIPNQGIGYQLGAVCVFAGGGQTSANQIQNLTIKDVILHDCWFGSQYNTMQTGSVGTMTDVILDHNGCSGQASPCHNAYWGFMTPGNFSSGVISGHGSHCEPTDPSNNSMGALFKSRWVGLTFTNYTMSEIDPYNRGYTDCNVAWVSDAACGGNYTWGGAGTGQGIVIQVGPNFGNVLPNPNGGFDLLRVGRDLGNGAFHGYIVPGTGSNGAPVGKGLLTVTSIEPQQPNGGSWLINQSAQQATMTIGQAGGDTSGNVALNTVISSQVTNADPTDYPSGGGTGTYIVTVSQTVASSGSPEAMTAVFNCGFYGVGYTDTACNTVFAQNCTMLLQNAWVILDNTAAPEGVPGQWASEASVFTIEPGYTSGRVSYKNSNFVMNVITPAPTGNVNSNGTLTNLSTNVNTLGWTVGMAVCDPSNLGGGGQDQLGWGYTISTIAGNGLSVTLNTSIPGATGQADTFYAGACLFPYTVRSGTSYGIATDAGGNTWFPNRAAAHAAVPSFPLTGLPAPM